MLIEKYLHGYHGLVKTFQNVAYYYQDELGSTSHIANASGALLEYYKYDLYGKPRVYNASGTYQPNATPKAQDLGNGGSRWMPELGLYDDRNRFMSPDLGRFLQPDPIGFKGDGSNLYRYCGNDWANRTDPTGMVEEKPGGNDVNLVGDLCKQAVDRAISSQMAKLQGIINDKIALGYGATQLAGAFQKMDQLQQSQTQLQTIDQGVGRTVTHDYNTNVKTSMKAEQIMGAVEHNINTFSDNYTSNQVNAGIYFSPEAIKQGQVYTITIPVLGLQPRVQATSVSQNSFTFTTMKGHFEAGTISFSAMNTKSGFNFNIHSAARASSWWNWAMYNYVGRQMQTATWNNFLRNVESYAAEHDGP